MSTNPAFDAEPDDGNSLPDKSKIRVCNLSNIAGCITEMRRVYVEMRKGKLDTLVGKRLIEALREIRVSYVEADLEQRLRELEQRR